MKREGQGSRVVVRGALIACVLLAWPPCALALNPALDVSEYSHSSWKVRDGFFESSITCFAQTPDGYLWLGSQFGLLRFDGVKAIAWRPPAGQSLPDGHIRSLLVARDGTLWIGTMNGVASWRDGRLTLYQELTGQTINALLEDRKQTTWIGTMARTGARLCAVHAGAVQCLGGDGRFGSGVTSLYEGKDGTLWVGVQAGLWRWQPALPTFHRFSTELIAFSNLVEDDDGALLIGTRAGIRRFVDATREELYRVALPTRQFARLFRDRDGGLWVGTEQGLLHVHQGRTDVFAQADGLSGDFVDRIFEDREGTIWVATVNGLDRFRELAVSTISVKQGLSYGIASSVQVGSDHSVWIGTRRGLNRWKDGQITTPLGRNTQVTSLFQSRSGR